MKKHYALLFLFITASFCLDAAPINDPIIAMIDGSVLDGAKIKNVITFLVELRLLLYGKKNIKTQLYEGIISINGKNYSIHQLAAIENECAQQDCQESECHCPISKQDLTTGLVRAKIMFEKAHEISQKDSKGTKKMSERLIKKWAKDTNRSQCYLLTWTEVPEHKEEESFNNVITSFREFDFFLEDITAFLKDLVASCPKAYQQYKESLKSNAS